MLALLIRSCMSRQATVLLGAALLLAAGTFAYLHTPIEAYPDVTNAQVNVITQAAGLAPEEVERQLTIPLERVLNGTHGMTLLRSESLFGLSLIWLTFDDDADTFRARADVLERLATAELPGGVHPELAPDYTPLGKIYYYLVQSDRHGLAERRAEQEWTISRVLRQVPGVADVVGLGGELREFHVEIEPGRLEAHDLSLADVTEALERSNLSIGGGFLKHGEQEMLVRSLGYITRATDVRSVLVRHDERGTVTIGEIARVIEGATPRRGTVGHNAEDEAVMGIALLRRGENPSAVLDGIREKVALLNDRMLPEGMRIEPIYDRSELIGHTMETVYRNLAHSAILVIAIVWFFLRSLRASLIVAAVIPVSLLAAFLGLYLIGLPANLISMGAIDFGILVGGAVVLTEAVMARLQRGPVPAGAMAGLVLESTLEVARPTFYAMAIIIAALIPVFTLQSVEGRIFSPLAMTYTFAMLGALAFTLAIVPGLCTLALRPAPGARRVREPGAIRALRRTYRRLLCLLLRHRWVCLGAAFLVLVAAGFTLRQIGTEFLPELNEGDVHVFVEMPASISLEHGQSLLAEVRHMLRGFPEVQSVTSEQGRPEDGTDNEDVNMAKVHVALRPPADWRRGLRREALIEQMRESLTIVPGVQFSFSQPIRDSIEEAVAGVRGQVVLKVFGSDLEAMRQTLAESIEVLRDVPGVVELGLYRDAMVPQVQVRIDREALAREGLLMDEIQAHIETALAGRVATVFWDGEHPVPVRVRLPETVRTDLSMIGSLSFVNADDALVPLRDVASIEVSDGRTFIPREQNMRYLALSFNVAGRDLGSVIREAIAAVDEAVAIPAGHWLEWGGEFENQRRAISRLMVIVPVSFLVVLVLLQAALGSLSGGLTILATTPIAISGGLFALRLSGIDLSVSAAIGFIALLGQISLLGLLVLSGIEQRRRAGCGPTWAVVRGSVGRFRAVLLDALLAAFGLVPMALATGLGSETQRPFAVVLVGGMVTVLLAAAFLVPVIHATLQREAAR